MFTMKWSWQGAALFDQHKLLIHLFFKEIWTHLDKGIIVSDVMSQNNQKGTIIFKEALILVQV